MLWRQIEQDVPVLGLQPSIRASVSTGWWVLCLQAKHSLCVSPCLPPHPAGGTAETRAGGRGKLDVSLSPVTASKWGQSLQGPASATTTVVPALTWWCECLSPALEGDQWFPTISNFWVASLPPLASQPLPSLIALTSCMKSHTPPSPTLPHPRHFKHSEWFLFFYWYLTNTLGKEIERK